MFGEETKLQNKAKKRKALLYAVLVTFIIAVLYVVLMRGSLYKFKGDTTNVASIFSSIKDTSKNISENVNKGVKVIKNK